ncbi:MAG TPA: glycosyltransferase family 1 protein [Candidatus Dormibacteraeota bacterium]|nr:glycosyltransferase family 1 protein [Candidatus Dormibacteraeota bacterium]
MVGAGTRLPTPAIAFDVTPLQNAHRHRGIGTYVLGLARRLAAQTEVPIEFWGWAGDGAFEVPPPHRILHLRRYPTPEYRGAWLFAQLAMKRRSALSSVRVVHLTDPDALTTLRHRHVMATVYDLIPLREGVSPRRPLVWAGYGTYLHALRRVETIFAISQQTAADVVDLLGVPAEKIVVAAPGIDLSPQENVSDDISTNEARPYFLFLGGPNPNKNLAVLLDAMAICTELPEELRIAGHWLPQQVAALDRDLQARGLRDRSRFVGFVPGADLPGLMKHATAVVVPSRMEGFGLPVGEGLAAGAVVVHSRIPVLEETSAGAALTFDPSSADELARNLRRAAGDLNLNSNLRQRGVRRAKELTWDVAVERTLAAYRAMLGR